MKKNEIEIEKYFIDYLVKTIKDKNLSSLEVTRTLSDKHKLKIKINNSVSSPTNQEVQTRKVENSSFKKDEFVTKETVYTPTKDANIIKSPMVGTVYLSPSPEELPFIHVGKKIMKGDTILIIEAMKTMNHVPSTADGEVKKILIEDGQPVEFGQTLVLLK